MDDEYPIIEQGTKFQEVMPPCRIIEVLNVWVDEDGETQVRIHETPSEGWDKKDPRTRTVTAEDIHSSLDTGHPTIEPIEE